MVQFRQLRLLLVERWVPRVYHCDLRLEEGIQTAECFLDPLTKTMNTIHPLHPHTIYHICRLVLWLLFLMNILCVSATAVLVLTHYLTQHFVVHADCVGTWLFAVFLDEFGLLQLLGRVRLVQWVSWKRTITCIWTWRLARSSRCSLKTFQSVLVVELGLRQSVIGGVHLLVQDHRVPFPLPVLPAFLLLLQYLTFLPHDLVFIHTNFVAFGMCDMLLCGMILFSRKLFSGNT